MSGVGSGAGATTEVRALPTGTVTFVFTDIEGSTRLLKRLPDVAPDLFERHREIVRAAIADHGGCEVSTEGDAFFVAFDDVDHAIAACAQLQRGLAGEPWPDGGEIRVRAGLHSGVAVPRGDNYIAMAVHQAARVVNTAHGGQIVATRSSLDSRRVASPVREVALGRFRVRDFDEPVELVRLDPIGAAPADRPLRAIPADGHNLVRLPTSFIGRESALAKVGEMISQGFIVSIVGPGGTGKTRLAVEVGLEHASEWADGVWLAELADVVDPALVASKIADAVGLSPAPDGDVGLELVAWARDRRVLLIIDNIESCLDACAALLPALAASGAAILTTGREPLNVPAEVVWRLEPLGVATLDSGDHALESSPAVELFVDRATAVRPDFDPAPHLADIARICSQVDGIPLAIEIAAARVKVLTVPEILDGLADRFSLLRSSERHLPERQRTLRGLLQWSYDLLDDDARAALRRLAVFAGSFTLRSATIALADSDRHTANVPEGVVLAADDIPELVWALFDKSLVALDQSGAGTRYRLLESVREFGLGLLVDSAESAVVVGRVATDLLDRVGPWRLADRQWLGEVAVEVANLRGIIGPLASIDHERAQAVACSLGGYHDATQRFEAGISELTSLTERLGEPTPTRAVLLATLADLHFRRGDQRQAEELLATATELRDRVGTPPWSGVAIERTQGEVLIRRGDFDGAAELARRVLERDLLVGDSARMWNLLGIAQLSAGGPDASEDAFRRELAAYVELDLSAKVASANGNVAEIALRRGDNPAAASYQLACLEEALVIGQPVMLAFSALLAAHLAGRLGQWAMAVRLQAAAVAGLDATGHRLYDFDVEELERLLADAGQHLDPEELEAENAAGAVLDSLQTAALTRRILEQVIADSVGAPTSTDQTPSERTSND
ncbi:MAG: adenylate/guanylate cyclase domain-containing protein [Ilumatobacteraceae bacterium]